MKQHKWAEVIKAWADGAEIECRDISVNGYWGEWVDSPIDWDDPHYEFRVKDEPKYLYVYADWSGITQRAFKSKNPHETYIGKIKLETE